MPEASEFVVALNFDTSAPAVARRFVADLAPDLSPESRADAELLVSEIVTNAIKYGRPEIVLTINLAPPLIGVAVRDSGNDAVESAEPAKAEATGGRGLYIVEALASDWGVVMADPPPGKTVWFRLNPADSNTGGS